jgi:hypothetical protein
MRRLLIVLPLAALAISAAPTASASCVASVRWKGGLYVGLEVSETKPLRLGGKLKGAVVPACNDTVPSSGDADEPVNIRRVRDVPTRLVVARPDQATPNHAFVYVRSATYWQAVNHPLRRALRPHLRKTFVKRTGCHSAVLRGRYKRTLQFGAGRIRVGSRTVVLEPPTRLGALWRKRPFKRGDPMRITGKRCGGLFVAHSIA